jgi:hypothetical protein
MLLVLFITKGADLDRARIFRMMLVPISPLSRGRLYRIAGSKRKWGRRVRDTPAALFHFELQERLR